MSTPETGDKIRQPPSPRSKARAIRVVWRRLMNGWERMCGIVGALAFEGSPFSVTENYINRMRDTMLHRGPDGAGTWVSPTGQVGLGHRRLAIIDLSEAAAQPMCNEEGTLWISFNGEIYNHSQIRQELEQTGRHRWKTDHSDTEVILHAFEEWGIDCLHKFRGMFAMALWDACEQELWLIRDRIGIKPLYYSIHHGRITFASEIKALLADQQQKREVHQEALFHYLSFLTTPSPQTLFDGIQKLAGGTWLCVSRNGQIQEHRYWEVWNQVNPLLETSEEEVSHRILSELRTSVRLRKIGDVPVGVFLSGGLDSSTNAALFSEEESDRIKTFTVGYEGDYQSYRNELHYARLMASTVGAEHHERLLKLGDLIDFLPQMVHFQDEPIADPVCVPLYYVSQLAREAGVIVCQVGEGADELFWGYPSWRRMLQLQRSNDLPIPVLLKKAGLSALRLLGKEQTFWYEWLRRGTENLPVFWGGAEAFAEAQKQRLLSPTMQKRFSNFTSWEALKPIRDRFDQGAWEKSHLNWMTYVDLNLRLPELLLMRVDKMSMGVSLEARVPFLDHKLVELALSLPQSLKTKNNVLKYLLKKSVRGLVPDQLIDRTKQGFGVPIYEWFLDRLGDRIRGEVTDFCKKTDFLNRNRVTELMNQGNGSQSWYLLNLALWWKQYIHG